MVLAMSILLMLLMGLLLFSGVWILTTNMNVDVDGKGLDILCSLCVLLMIAWMSKVYRFITEWKDTGQVGKWNPHWSYGTLGFWWSKRSKRGGNDPKLING